MSRIRSIINAAKEGIEAFKDSRRGVSHVSREAEPVLTEAAEAAKKASLPKVKRDADGNWVDAKTGAKVETAPGGNGAKPPTGTNNTASAAADPPVPPKGGAATSAATDAARPLNQVFDNPEQLKAVTTVIDKVDYLLKAKRVSPGDFKDVQVTASEWGTLKAALREKGLLVDKPLLDATGKPLKRSPEEALHGVLDGQAGRKITEAEFDKLRGNVDTKQATLGAAIAKATTPPAPPGILRSAFNKVVGTIAVATGIGVAGVGVAYVALPDGTLPRLSEGTGGAVRSATAQGAAAMGLQHNTDQAEANAYKKQLDMINQGLGGGTNPLLGEAELKTISADVAARMQAKTRDDQKLTYGEALDAVQESINAAGGDIKGKVGGKIDQMKQQMGDNRNAVALTFTPAP